MIHVCHKFRILVGILMFFICWSSSLVRVNFSIVLMHITTLANTTIKGDPLCDVVVNRGFLINYPFSKYLTPLKLGAVLASYDVGYSLSLMFYKLAASALGASITVGYSMLISAGLTALTFYAFEFSVIMLMALRLFLGFLAGAVLPLITVLVIKWSPENERNAFGMVLFGYSAGVIVTFPVGGYIMMHYSSKWVMYISAIFVFTWACVWLIFVRDDPFMHKLVSTEEKITIAHQGRGPRHSMELRNTRKQVPWKEVLRSSQIKALFILMWSNTWVLSFYTNFIPLYFNRLLGYNVVEASVLSSLPFAARVVFGIVCIPIVKLILHTTFLSVTTTRKGFTFFSHVIPALVEIFLLFSVCSKPTYTLKAIVVLGLNGAVIVGGMVNIGDLTPHYAGTVFAAMQSVLCLSGALMSMVSGFILMYYDGHVIAWLILLGINCAWYMLGGLVFITFGSGTVQPWDVASVRRNVLHGIIAEDESSSD